MDVSTLKALTFDAFGTVVDWPSTVIQETERLGQAEGITPRPMEYGTQRKENTAMSLG